MKCEITSEAADAVLVEFDVVVAVIMVKGTEAAADVKAVVALIPENNKGVYAQ